MLLEPERFLVHRHSRVKKLYKGHEKMTTADLVLIQSPPHKYIER